MTEQHLRMVLRMDSCVFAVVIIVNWLLMSVQFCPGNKAALGSAGPWHSQAEVLVPLPAVLSANVLTAGGCSW